jgi:hypothetical protein
VNVLHTIHRALTPDGILVDTQPISARPPVSANGVELGTLDMREWLETIDAVDELIVSTITSGLYDLQHERRLVVTDTYDSGAEFLETVGTWVGTRIPDRLARSARAAEPPITVRQEVRLRVLGPGRGADSDPD